MIVELRLYQLRVLSQRIRCHDLVMIDLRSQNEGSFFQRVVAVYVRPGTIYTCYKTGGSRMRLSLPTRISVSRFNLRKMCSHNYFFNLQPLYHRVIFFILIFLLTTNSSLRLQPYLFLK